MSAIIVCDVRKKGRTKNDKTKIPKEYLPTHEENEVFLKRANTVY